MKVHNIHIKCHVSFVLVFSIPHWNQQKNSYSVHWASAQAHLQSWIHVCKQWLVCASGQRWWVGGACTRTEIGPYCLGVGSHGFFPPSRLWGHQEKWAATTSPSLVSNQPLEDAPLPVSDRPLMTPSIRRHQSPMHLEMIVESREIANLSAQNRIPVGPLCWLSITLRGCVRAMSHGTLSTSSMHLKCQRHFGQAR